MRGAGAPRQRPRRAASQQGGDRGAPGALAIGRGCRRERRAIADAEPAHRARAAAREAGTPRVPAAAAAQDAADAGVAREAARVEAGAVAEENAAARIFGVI